VSIFSRQLGKEIPAALASVLPDVTSAIEYFDPKVSQPTRVNAVRVDYVIERRHVFSMVLTKPSLAALMCFVFVRKWTLFRV
jgi:hypothetical protein